MLAFDSMQVLCQALVSRLFALAFAVALVCNSYAQGLVSIQI